MKKVFLFAAAALTLAACNNDNYDESPVAAQITATIGGSVTSRAADALWAEGDMIGITTTFNSQTGPFINVKYTTAAGDGAFAGKTIYIYNPMSLTAYYPFADEEDALPGTNGIIESVTNAENQTPEKQPLIDFLFASKTGITSDQPKIELVFTHSMSKFTLILVDGSGVDVSKITSYKIEGLVLAGTFNTATGECAVKSDATAAPLNINVEGVETGKPLSSLILFPQSTLDKEVKLTITDSENQVYSCKLNFTDNSLAAGSNYQYTITVNKTGLVVNESTITDWDKKELTGDAGSELS